MNPTFYPLQDPLSGWLQKIIQQKREEIARNISRLYPEPNSVKPTKKFPLVPNFFQRLKNTTCASTKKNPYNLHLIAEFKVRSPSNLLPAKHSMDTMLALYHDRGHAISILCNDFFFGGSMLDLQKASAYMNGVSSPKEPLPILCKEFIISPCQILLARQMGASAVLLMASVLSPKGLHEANTFAQALNLTPLIEIHTKEEWEIVRDIPNTTIGLNNRSLGDLSIDIHRAAEILPLIPETYLRIIESGVNNPEDIKYYERTADAFLIGTAFMRAKNPVQKIRELGW